ncbi:CHAP domain-containing protein, partial [Flavobacterium psychrophilum]|nr:CHAP domain-containing protein [Flavobacterium psychrophilum]
GKGLGHTGIVEKVIEKTIYTIEGNTNDDGSREGYKVCRRKRNIKTIKAFIRL